MTVDRMSLPWGNMVKRSAIERDTLVHVDRDPCPKCGIRGDIGCKHKKREWSL